MTHRKTVFSVACVFADDKTKSFRQFAPVNVSKNKNQIAFLSVLEYCVINMHKSLASVRKKEEAYA